MINKPKESAIDAESREFIAQFSYFAYAVALIEALPRSDQILIAEYYKAKGGDWKPET